MLASRRAGRRAGRAVAAATAAAAAATGAVAVAGALHGPHRKTTPKPASASRARAAAPTPSSHGRITVLTLPARDVPRGRKVWIYRPGVADAASIPVVYFLHGLPGSYRDLATLGVQHELDRLIATRRLPPLVLVVPDGNSNAATDPEWADAPDHGLRLEGFVVGALRRQVEGRHPRDRAHRAIIGFSMGGYGAMNIALHHPQLYGSVASIAGYFSTDDESGIFDGDADKLDRNRPDRHAATARGLRVMLADATGDREPVTRGETQRFAALLRRNGISPYVDIRPGAHDPEFLQAELPRTLSFLTGTGG